MVTVHFYGHLRKQFGPKLRLAIDTPAEAIRLLEANFPGRGYKAFREGYYFVKRGETLKDSVNLPLAAIKAGLAGRDLHFVPVPRGSANHAKGIIAAVLGVALIAGAIVLSGGVAAVAASGFASVGFGGLSYGTFAGIGAALLLGGITSLLAPGTPSTQQSNNTQTMFAGPINTVQQGCCVPVIYGRCLVGSITVSAGIHDVQLSYDVNLAANNRGETVGRFLDATDLPQS